MATVGKAGTLLKRGFLSNISAREGLNITLLLSGAHGIGKSQIVKSAAKGLGGLCLVVEGGLLCEGEFGGLPAMFKNEKGESEVRFCQYYVVKKIHELQEYYYERATTIGFLNGKIKLEVEGNGNRWLVYT